MKIQYILLELLFKNSTFEIYTILYYYIHICVMLYIFIIYTYIPLITCIFLWYFYDLNLQLTDRTNFFKILISTHFFPNVFYSEKCFRIIILNNLLLDDIDMNDNNNYWHIIIIFTWL